MPRFAPEPAHVHGSPERTAVLLVNLGTPAAPTAAALKPYLREFLSDPRVVEIPRALWWLVLNGVILNVRPRKSAEKYAKIWLPEGSPLAVHTARQARLLQGLLGERGRRDMLIGWAMRYGEPSVASVLDKLSEAGARRILVVPMYPQYAASTTASVADAVAAWSLRRRNLPGFRSVRAFPDHPGYIRALRDAVERHWTRHGRPDSLVMSFHGLPRRSLDLGDPYHCECRKTGRLLAEALALPRERYAVTFQSRFGRAEWLQPYTQPTLETMAREGVGRVDVVCPGFVADCLETLEEIAIECKAAFLAGGGKEFHYIPCLNEDAGWIAALGDLVETHLQGWPDLVAGDPAAAARAKALGASR